MRFRNFVDSFKGELSKSLILRIVCSFWASVVFAGVLSVLISSILSPIHIGSTFILLFCLSFTVLILKSLGKFQKQFKSIDNKIIECVKNLKTNLICRIVVSVIISAFCGLIAAVVVEVVFNENLGSLVVFIIVAAIVLTKLLKKIFVHIKDITEGVEKISSGDFSVQIPEIYSDELGMLAKRINKMAADLEAAKKREMLEEQRKNDFITSIAHDLRTPLTSITGYLGLISAKDGNTLDKETMFQYADTAYRKSLRLETLINNLFDFSRYNFGVINPAKNQIDLGELLEQLDQEFYPQYSENNLQSRVIISGKPIVIGDGNMLARVFENLLNNAVRYGSNGRYIDIEAVTRAQEVQVNITNYSSLINSEDLTRIFDKFYRTESSRNSTTGGTGLGLAIAKNIVIAHSGQIFAKSIDGKTVFSVVLPIKQ